jgi:hypothetical protein
MPAILSIGWDYAAALFELQAFSPAFLDVSGLINRPGKF